jgi:hypothetical protein
MSSELRLLWMTRPFFFARTPRVVTMLRRVKTDSRRVLTERFYLILRESVLC